MWTIKNNTPFKAKGAIRLDHETARKQWLVAVKATFDLRENGSPVISDCQEEVLDDPVYSGEETASSLLYDSDLMGLKQKVDMIVNGTAYQPGGTAKKDCIVGITIGHWGKTLRVVGDRLWDRFLGVALTTLTQPFVRMPITYENAYGGVDKTAKPELRSDYRNTVGKGYAAKKSHLYGKPMPNIEYPDAPTRANYKKNRIAGFGAIPNHWKPRIDYGGTYGEQWLQSQEPFLPSDFSPLFYQSAPQDQQLDVLPGGENVTLLNLTSNKSEFSFMLPEVDFYLASQMGRSLKSHRAGLQTVIVEPELSRLILVWQSALDCHDTNGAVETTTIDCVFNKSTLDLSSPAH